MSNGVNKFQFAAFSFSRLMDQLWMETKLIIKLIVLMYGMGIDIHDLSATTSQINHATVPDDELDFCLARFIVTEWDEIAVADEPRLQTKLCGLHNGAKEAWNRCFKQLRMCADGGQRDPCQPVRIHVLRKGPGNLRPHLLQVCGN